MGGMSACSVDAVVSDPPYGLEFMGKDWDRGVPGSHFWEEALRVAKPGAWLLAFGGTRTWHRLACAIEDAGWELRDTVMWVYGSGFPKSLDVSKALDKAAGAEREVVGKAVSQGGRSGSTASVGQHLIDSGREYDITAPSTDLAKQWQGWGTALKPSFEPLLLCRKPLTTVPLDSIIVEVQHMLGGLLCLSLLNVKSADCLSQSSLNVSGEVCVSALVIANVLLGTTSNEWCDTMVMSSSLETVQTCWSIVKSWNDILDVVSSSPSTFTTEMATKLTTGLKILHSLLLTNIPASVTKAVSQTVGLTSTATTAESCSAEESVNRTNIQTAIAHVLASFSQNSDGIPADAAVARSLQTIQSVGTVLYDVLRELIPLPGPKVSPSWEPVLVCRKPVEGTVASNVSKWGTGGLNIDGCRIPLNGDTPKGSGGACRTSGTDHDWGYKGNGGNFTPSTGRWPSNFIHDGSHEVVRLFPETKNGGVQRRSWHTGRAASRCKGAEYRHETLSSFGDSGSAARFFYVPKASKADRDEGCEGLEIRSHSSMSGRRNADDMNDYKTDNDVTDRFVTQAKNFHPTVKPTALMRYLCRLVTPPNGLVLDPFMGSGSTGKGAILEGFRFIGIDISEEYCQIARARIEKALSMRDLQLPLEAVNV